MKALLLTNEYPPNVYGGAGIHVDYLSREMARLIGVEVRAFGDQGFERPGLRVRGFGAGGADADCPAALRPVFGAVRRCVEFNAAGIGRMFVRLRVAGQTARRKSRPTGSTAGLWPRRCGAT